MTNIWDRFGRLIGSVQETGNSGQNTYDEHGQPLGSVRETGTYDKGGRKVSTTRDAGLTFGKKPS
jgi:YD repeat-containing protein